MICNRLTLEWPIINRLCWLCSNGSCTARSTNLESKFSFFYIFKLCGNNGKSQRNNQWVDTLFYWLLLRVYSIEVHVVVSLIKRNIVSIVSGIWIIVEKTADRRRHYLLMKARRFFRLFDFDCCWLRRNKTTNLLMSILIMIYDE